MERREFLRVASAAGVVIPWWTLLPAAHAQAVYSGRILINIHADGGIDQSSWTDPREKDTAINNYAAAGTPAGVSGNIRSAPMGNNKAFFDAHFRQTLVINGVHSETNGHDEGTRAHATGRLDMGYPNIAELFAFTYGKGMPMPWLNNGGFRISAGLVPPTAVPDLEFGSYGFQRYALKGGGATDGFNGMASASYFSVDGYREHSAARKAQFNTKIGYSLNETNRLTLVANGFNQPNAQDPLGLTQQQVQQNPRQAQPVAIAFDTRRSLDNLQGGLIWDSTLDANDSLRVLGYVGSRNNEQFLAVPLASQLAATSSGGVSKLDRQLTGAAVRWTRQQDLFGGPLTLTAGAEYDASTEARQGFINDLGVRGALKRDEDNDVDVFARFMRSTGVPPREAGLAATPDARAGEALFRRVGCVNCHVPTIVTSPAASRTRSASRGLTTTTAPVSRARSKMKWTSSTPSSRVHS